MDLSTGKQLTLSVNVRQDASFNHFLGTLNEKCAILLKEGIRLGEETLFFVSGAKEAGKTHLVSAAIHFGESKGRSVGYFAMNELDGNDEHNDALFDVLGGFDLVVLENIDRWIQPGHREERLFNLFNEFKQTGRQIVLTARQAVAQLSIDLKDLFSRLQSGLSLALVPLFDDDKQKMLEMSAEERGLPLSREVSSFIIKRSGRNIGQLFAVLDQLDRASLQEKRRLTVPFVKKVMDW